MSNGEKSISLVANAVYLQMAVASGCVIFGSRNNTALFLLAACIVEGSLFFLGLSSAMSTYDTTHLGLNLHPLNNKTVRWLGSMHTLTFGLGILFYAITK